MSKDKSGPAFPTQDSEYFDAIGGREVRAYGGMTVHEVYVGLAMAGLVASGKHSRSDDGIVSKARQLATEAIKQRDGEG